MLTYLEISFSFSPFNPWNEIAVVKLAEIGFESFIEEGQVVKAYIEKGAFQKENFDDIVHFFQHQESLGFQYEIIEIPPQNWNAKWEEDFQPVYIDDDLSIVAPFHGSDFRRNLVIEIEPKMSFGTGHHQTTYLMCKAMKNLNWQNSKVLDMGTGTGVLAIYAEKLGSKEIHAVDIESWSVENTIENAIRNHCNSIHSYEGNIDKVKDNDYSVILANINKNVLKSHLPEYGKKLKKEGVLLLSGFFCNDNEEIISSSIHSGFNLVKKYDKENWSCLEFAKN